MIALLVVVVGALVAYHAEHPVNHEFATYGDSLWWAIVTLTTVGYGDIVPITPTGRWVAVMIMITGVAVLGLLSGSLASFFRGGESRDATSTSKDSEGEPEAGEPTPATRLPDGALQALVHEVSALRAPGGVALRAPPAPPGRGRPLGGARRRAVGRGPALIARAPV